jgi:uncharacterized protein (DUF4415 family)
MKEILDFEDTDISDCPELTEEQMSRMKPRYPEHFRPIKKAVQIRLDSDVLSWLKESGKGYQTRINTILRDAMLEDHQTALSR